MRILCMIDGLGSGGAQRQLCTLGTGLKRRGHDVRFLVYHPEDHFLPILEESGIHCDRIPPCSYSKRIMAIRRFLRTGNQDVVLAFLEASSLYAELASVPTRRWGLVVGERLATPLLCHGAGAWLRQFHRFADAVVCNSHTNRLLLTQLFPFVTKKVCTIYNAVDVDLFCAGESTQRDNERNGDDGCRIVVAASYQEKKNMMNVARALLILKNETDAPAVVVDWYGGMPKDQKPFDQVVQFVGQNGLSSSLRLHQATRTIAGEYRSASAIGLFSHFEGLPNVVCEAMSCAKPILLSNVCDASSLVQQGRNGVLCDPASPEDIARALRQMAALSRQARSQMGEESRRMASDLFSRSVITDRYEAVLQAARERKPPPTDVSWPINVPESATNTVKKWLRKGTSP